jgi:hypothetical protein
LRTASIAPRLHSELLELGPEVALATVAKRIVGKRRTYSSAS